MVDVEEAAKDLLERKPWLEKGLRKVLKIDGEKEVWEFSDLGGAIEPGVFGEIVSLGIVDKTGKGYFLSDRKALEKVLSRRESLGRSLQAFTEKGLIGWKVSSTALAAVIGLGVYLRTYVFRDVFRGGRVVLLSNDPYYYLYWVEFVEGKANGVLDFSVVSSLPGAVAKGEPLLVSSAWWVTELLGGSSFTAGAVLAWYPVISAVLTFLLIYFVGTRITGDRRVGLVSAAILAVIPYYVFRTALGFADHHAFDYPWLVLTLTGLTLISSSQGLDLGSRKDWFFSGVLGLGVAGQALAWDNGPILLGGLGIFFVFKTFLESKNNRSILNYGFFVVTGLFFASIFSFAAHVGLGWQTGRVAFSPVLLLVSVSALVLLGEVFNRLGLSWKALMVSELGLLVSGFFVLRYLMPSYWAGLETGIDRLFARTGIMEMLPLTSGGLFRGPFFIFGLTLFFAIPFLAIVSWDVLGRDKPRWVPVTVYAWYFFVLSLVQRRFAGELSPIIAIFAGYGLIRVSTYVKDLSERKELFEQKIGGIRSSNLLSVATILAVFIVLAGTGLPNTQTMYESISIKDESFESALYMAHYSESQGWGYPDNYVFSHWGRNRMFNYFVNGQSKSYAFAQGNFKNFLAMLQPF